MSVVKAVIRIITRLVCMPLIITVKRITQPHTSRTLRTVMGIRVTVILALTK